VPELAELQIATPYHAAFGAWAALERGALEEAERLLAAPSLSPKVSVSGHVYDIATGHLTTTVDARYP
jgi:carbonic anhydrase